MALTNPNKVNKVSAGLLSSTSRVEAPFIRLDIGGYTFGVYEGRSKNRNALGFAISTGIKYPNYVLSMTVDKINGTVNLYEVTFKYPITEDNDPNFFERVFSNILKKRTVKIDYGDFTLPNYIYRSEEAIITNLSEDIDVKSSVITYVLKAVSSSNLTLSGCYNFQGGTFKPSDRIMLLLYSNLYHLLDVFTGMRDRNMVESLGLIQRNDQVVTVPTFTNVSVLQYISNLVQYMSPTPLKLVVYYTNSYDYEVPLDATSVHYVSTDTIDVGNSKTSAVQREDVSIIKSAVYTLTALEDIDGALGGPYFKVQLVQTNSEALDSLCTQVIDIGYPTGTIVKDLRFDRNENWSILYDYNMSNIGSPYVSRIDSKGNEYKEYSPLINGVHYDIEENDRTWWTKVTGFPITAKLEIKGLLRPAILMTNVKLNVFFYGRKHISSGYYLVTSQKDSISDSGYFTTLGLLRVASDG